MYGIILDILVYIRCSCYNSLSIPAYTYSTRFLGSQFHKKFILSQFRKIYCVNEMYELFYIFVSSSLLFIGQLSCLEVLPMSLSLLSCRMEQSYISWSFIWLPTSQGQSGDSIILNRCRYDLVLP